MSHELLLQSLKIAISPEQKAALVAESIIQDFSPRLAEIAIWCSFMPWFSEDTIRSMSNEGLKDGDIELIVGLPFVEKITLGYCFHSTTHRGLLRKYKNENPNQIIKAFEVVQRINAYSSETPKSLILKLYGYVITNQGAEAEKLLIELMERGESKYYSALSEIDEAEEFCVSETTGLTSKYWHYRSQLFLLEKKYQSVIDCCDKAISIDNRYAHAYSTRGVAEAALGNFEAAFRDVNFAIYLKPDGLAYRSRAGIYVLKKEFRNAIFDFSRAIRVEPQDILAYTQRALTYLSTGNRARAFEDLDFALNMTDDNDVKAFVYLNYARAMILAGEWEKALEYLDKGIQIKPNGGAYRRKGDILTKLNRIDEAKECYRLALNFDNENYFAYLGQGKLSLNSGDYQIAIQDLEKASTLKKMIDTVPQNPFGEDEIILRLWEAYIRIGEVKKAEEYKNALLETKNESQLSELLFFCRKYQLFDTLLDVSKKMIELTRENKNVSVIMYTAAGYALNCLGKYKEALVYFDKAISLSSENENAKINIGISNWGLENYQDANKCFEEANKLLNKKPDAKNFKKSRKSTTSFSSERIWLMAMLNSPLEGIRNLESRLTEKQAKLGDFYDLRDWCLVVKRFPANLPDGFEEFSDYVNQLISVYGGDSIYSFIAGI